MAALRLRRVRFKDGRTIEVLRRPEPATVNKRFRSSAADASEDDLVAFAIVGWKANGEIFVDYENSVRSNVPAGALPQLAKDALLGEVAVRWSKD
jgi:hypothetical protein